MLPESLQPDEDVLHVELTTFRDHCRANKPDIKTIAEAARCAKELQTIFPLTSRCYHVIPSRRHQVNADSDAFNTVARKGQAFSVETRSFSVQTRCYSMEIKLLRGILPLFCHGKPFLRTNMQLLRGNTQLLRGSTSHFCKKTIRWPERGTSSP